MNATTIKIDRKKVAQILALYAFALMAAVSCGPAMNPTDDVKVLTFDTSVTFKPTLAEVSKTGPMDQVFVSYKLLDGSRAVSHTTYHSIAETRYSKTIDNVTYDFHDVCVSRTCNEIALLVERSAPGEKREQTAFWITGTGATMKVSAQINGTSYARPTEALSALKTVQ